MLKRIQTWADRPGPPVPADRIALLGAAWILVGCVADCVLWVVGALPLMLGHATGLVPWKVEQRSTLSGDVLRSWREPNRAAAVERKRQVLRLRSGPAD